MFETDTFGTNRPLARRRHFTTTTKMLQGFAFLCKLWLCYLILAGITKFKNGRENVKDSGRSIKMAPSCKCPTVNITFTGVKCFLPNVMNKIPSSNPRCRNNCERHFGSSSLFLFLKWRMPNNTIQKMPQTFDRAEPVYD